MTDDLPEQSAMFLTANTFKKQFISLPLGF